MAGRRQQAGGRAFFEAASLLGPGVAVSALGLLFAWVHSVNGAALIGQWNKWVVVVAGLALLMMYFRRTGEENPVAEPIQKARERLQANRTRDLWLLPAATLLLLAQATTAMGGLEAGDVRYTDGLRMFLPVVCAWTAALIAMGRDVAGKPHRHLLDDELTAALRARAIGAAFMVLMIGATVALGLGLWRPEVGIMAALFAISAAGMTAGIRFAWLDREAGLDG